MNRETDFRPTSEALFKHAIAQGLPLWTHCSRCDQEFSNSNTHSAEGWKDTQIIGWCEDCSDEIFKDEE